jgi:hypothetical protein
MKLPAAYTKGLAFVCWTPGPTGFEQNGSGIRLKIAVIV